MSFVILLSTTWSHAFLLISTNNRVPKYLDNALPRLSLSIDRLYLLCNIGYAFLGEYFFSRITTIVCVIAFPSNFYFSLKTHFIEFSVGFSKIEKRSRKSSLRKFHLTFYQSFNYGMNQFLILQFVVLFYDLQSVDFTHVIHPSNKPTLQIFTYS